MASARKPRLRLLLIPGFLLLGLTLPSFVSASSGSDPSIRALFALKAGCGSARTPGQWKARCPRVGKRGLTVIGSPGRHVLRGTSWNDTIFAGKGGHVVYANAGNDRVVAGPAPNRISTGAGNDLAEARNGYRDVVDCGGGHDIASVDKIDRVRHCAVVLRQRRQPGTKGNPIPRGASAQLGDGWKLKIVDVPADPDRRVEDAGKGQNSPPRKGHQFYLVKVSAKRTRKPAARLNAGYRLRALPGPGGPYTTFRNPCGILPELDLEIVNRYTSVGKTVTGYICWEVRKKDAHKLVMFNVAGPERSRQVYFSLR